MSSSYTLWLSHNLPIIQSFLNLGQSIHITIIQPLPTIQDAESQENSIELHDLSHIVRRISLPTAALPLASLPLASLPLASFPLASLPPTKQSAPFRCTGKCPLTCKIPGPHLRGCLAVVIQVYSLLPFKGGELQQTESGLVRMPSKYVDDGLSDWERRYRRYRLVRMLANPDERDRLRAEAERVRGRMVTAEQWDHVLEREAARLKIAWTREMRSQWEN
ncbi:hypothetical protein TARUN_6199 [Trichoderma arundinaceum]|uniref:Uncharacterized protein n=1 Tax=Trichoderma arundinaceum TaxID=490622 RepID=A0A395NIY5_TRIAR|nr:hypothetical protein TARUN_6199 [Trichoderma arundinaceum]